MAYSNIHNENWRNMFWRNKIGRHWNGVQVKLTLSIIVGLVDLNLKVY